MAYDPAWSTTLLARVAVCRATRHKVHVAKHLKPEGQLESGKAGKLAEH